MTSRFYLGFREDDTNVEQNKRPLTTLKRAAVLFNSYPLMASEQLPPRRIQLEGDVLDQREDEEEDDRPLSGFAKFDRVEDLLKAHGKIRAKNIR